MKTMLGGASPYVYLEKASQRGLKVLLVEDNPTNRRVMTVVLERLPAKLTCAENGEEGVDAFQLETFDVVLMDLKMPLMDGYEAIRRIRSLEALSQRPRTPIIVVSAHTRGREVAEAKAAGADHHLGKPLDIPSLLKTMDLVGRTRDPEPRAAHQNSGSAGGASDAPVLNERGLPS